MFFRQCVLSYVIKTPNLVKSFNTNNACLRTIFACDTLIICIYIGIYIGNNLCEKGLPLTNTLIYKIIDVLDNQTIAK